MAETIKLTRRLEIMAHSHTANQALIKNLQMAEELVTQLRAKLDNYHQVAETGTRNWGYAGDVAHIVSELDQLINPR